MPYFTRSQIEAEIPAADLVALLDDDHDGTEDDDLYTALADRAEARCNAVLAPRYAVPFADGSVPLVVAETAILAMCAGLRRRRGVPDAENPFAEREERLLARLAACADGTANLAVSDGASSVVAPELAWSFPNQEGLC